MDQIIVILKVLAFMGVLVFTHELGHYLMAKYRKIYAGWGISSKSVYVKLKKPAPKAYDYWSGVAGSYLAFPIFVLLFKPPTITHIFNSFFWIFTPLALFLGAFDIFLSINPRIVADGC